MLVPTGAYGCMNEMLLPPFRLPWRLVAPLHTLHGGAIILATYPDVARLLGAGPRLSRDARAICDAVHDTTLLIAGLLHDGASRAACAGASALSSAMLFCSVALALVLPQVYSYAGARPAGRPAGRPEAG
jgi:hypothetical protein